MATDLKNYVSILGWPQGSVLGPLLFILHINDLPYASSLLTKLYADDTCLIFSTKTVDELQITINSEMNKIQNWMFSNKLSINYSKTKYMLNKVDTVRHLYGGGS